MTNAAKLIAEIAPLDLSVCDALGTGEIFVIQANLTEETATTLENDGPTGPDFDQWFESELTSAGLAIVDQTSDTLTGPVLTVIGAAQRLGIAVTVDGAPYAN
jgi:hypothetical protein